VGIFGKKTNSDASVLMATIVTFGQSINAVEQANNLELGEAWDIFVNSIALLVDAGLLDELEGDSVANMGALPENHNLKVDLLGLRAHNSRVTKFIDDNKRVLEIIYSPRNIDSKVDWTPNDFADKLASMAQSSFPDFGSTRKDQGFYAVMGIFMMTLISDTQFDSNTNKTIRRYIGYEFALRFLAQWNIAKLLSN
jgi:hypothetical protein